MLSWVLSRNAAQADASPDDTNIEQPDTPAPIFAARALKTALFGTPAPQSEEENRASLPAALASNATTVDPKSPTKPQGILLTPGTATARRKRVSFGHDVKDSLLAVDALGATSGDEGILAKGPSRTGLEPSQSRPRTRLSEALERSRKKKDATAHASAPHHRNKQPADNDPEEEEDDDLPDADPDVTVDLNEPRSGSGKYWKSSFETYHAEAMVEMEKLVKYKQLAKSYAQTKDAEALQLNQRLRAEQEKVAQMEKRVTELAQDTLVKKRGAATGTSAGGFDKDLMDKLTRQTVLTSQYQAQVRELEALLAETEPTSTTGNAAAGAAEHRRRTASPRTQKTLMETQRELRRARAGIRELATLRDEVRQLKAASLSAEEKFAKLASEKKKLSQDLAQSNERAHDAEKRLEKAEAEAVGKTAELKALRADYDRLKASAKARFVEAEEVVRKKNEKIAELKKEARSMQSSLQPRDEQPWMAKLKELSAQLEADRERRQLDREVSAEHVRDFTLELERQRKQVQDFKLADLPFVDSGNEGAREDSIPSNQPTRPRRQASTQSRRSASKSLANVEGERRPAVLTDLLNLADTAKGALDSEREQTDGIFKPKHQLSRTPEADIRITRRSSRASAATGQPLTTGTPVRNSSAKELDTSGLDLAENHFARLGAATGAVNGSTVLGASSPKTGLPADRRAAAIARLERKKVERMRAHRGALVEKENVAP